MGVRDKIAKALMGAIGGPNKLGAGGIDVYHSSPHTFDRFDLGKIGSGEGAQVYGHGLYFAENPAVSGQGGQYWNQFMGHPALTPGQQHAGSRLRAEGFDREKAIAATQRDVDDWKSGAMRNNPEYTAKMLAIREAELEALMKGMAGPRTYEANIKADPVRFLDWDKSLDAQPHIGEVLRQKGFKDAPWPYSGLHGAHSMLQPLDSGEDVYRALGREWMAGKRFENPDMRRDARKYATETLGEAGVPGIKYLDEGSRGRQISNKDALWQEPLTSNYVVFDPASIDIRKMYAAPVAAAPVLGAIGDESKYEVQP